MQNRVYEGLARLVMQREYLELFDRLCRSLLSACNEELRDRRAAQRRSARDQLLLLGGHPGFQSIRLGCPASRVGRPWTHIPHDVDIVRRLAVRVNPDVPAFLTRFLGRWIPVAAQGWQYPSDGGT